MVVLEIFGSLFVQLAFTAGFVVLYGTLISLCNRCFYEACGKRAFVIVRATGLVGTPIHELSHALMCLLFGHSIKKISLFGDSARSKTLGYVEHTYYKRNLYQQIGNFFIGIAPILAGGGVILLLVRLLTPRMFFAMSAESVALGSALLSNGDGQVFLSLLRGIGSLLLEFFSFDNFSDWRWWLCAIFAFSIAIHMEISRSDIRSGLRGFGVITGMLLIADAILGLLFPAALDAVTGATVTAGVFVAFAMTIPAVFSLLIGIISLIVLFLRTAIRSFQNDRASQ